MGAASRRGEPSRLLAVARALAAGRQLRLRYQDALGGATHRQVSPLGLSWRNGHWLLAAHCHLRRAFRHFRVDRIETARTARGRVTEGLAPPGFDGRFFSAEGYLHSGQGPPALQTVRLGPPLSGLAPALFPAALLEWPAGEAVLCHLRVSDPFALMGLVDSLGPGASIVRAWPGASEVRPG